MHSSILRPSLFILSGCLNKSFRGPWLSFILFIFHIIAILLQSSPPTITFWFCLLPLNVRILYCKYLQQFPAWNAPFYGTVIYIAQGHILHLILQHLFYNICPCPCSSAVTNIGKPTLLPKVTNESLLYAIFFSNFYYFLRCLQIKLPNAAQPFFQQFSFPLHH